MAEYYPDYAPENADKFSQVLKALKCADTPKELQTVSMLFVLDMSYPRQDIYVAIRKVEREKGWG